MTAQSNLSALLANVLVDHRHQAALAMEVADRTLAGLTPESSELWDAVYSGHSRLVLQILRNAGVLSEASLSARDLTFDHLHLAACAAYEAQEWSLLNSIAEVAVAESLQSLDSHSHLLCKILLRQIWSNIRNATGSPNTAMLESLLGLAKRSKLEEQLACIGEISHVQAYLAFTQDGDTIGASRRIDTAVALLREHGTRVAQVRALIFRSFTSRVSGKITTAEASLDEALSLALQTSNPHLVREVEMNLVSTSYRQGDFQQAWSHLHAAKSLGVLKRNDWISIMIRTAELRLATMSGKLVRARRCAKLLATCIEHMDMRRRAQFNEECGSLALAAGDAEGGLLAYQSAMDILTAGGVQSYEVAELQLRYSEALNALGRHIEARDACNSALERLSRVGEGLERGHVYRQRGIANYSLGRLNDALKDFNAAERELRRVGDKYELTRLLLDRCDYFPERLETSLRDADEAMLLAHQVGLPSLLMRARDVAEIAAMRARSRDHATRVLAAQLHDGTDVIAESAAMQEVMARSIAFGYQDLPVLITGETGVGKEIVAQTVHASSKRAQKRLVSLNCAALPESLMERELFGHVRGAFTGADRDAPGLIDVADGGTLFLDEIGELPMQLQAKLLRILQDGAYRPVGSTNEKRSNLRVIAATHRDLRQMMKAGRFREDLYYRIACLRVHIAPLRERPEDIDAIAKLVMEEASVQHGIGIWMEKEAWQILRRLSWPGNVRQLQMVMRAMCVHSLPDGVIRTRHLEEQMGDELQALQSNRILAPLHLQREVEAFERRLILNALRQSNFCRTSAAKLLGLGRNTIYEKMKRLGMDPQDPEPRKSTTPRRREHKGEA